MQERVKDENSNPWSASSIYDFYYFCCPECDDKSKSKQEFVDHASSYHNEASLKIFQIRENI